MSLAMASAVVATDGSMTENNNVESCTKEGTGNYMVTYKNVFASAPGVSATPWAGGTLVSLNIFAENVCQVLTTDLSGKAIDGAFSFLAVGSD